MARKFIRYISSGLQNIIFKYIRRRKNAGFLRLFLHLFLKFISYFVTCQLYRHSLNALFKSIYFSIVGCKEGSEYTNPAFTAPDRDLKIGHFWYATFTNKPFRDFLYILRLYSAEPSLLTSEFKTSDRVR